MFSKFRALTMFTLIVVTSLGNFALGTTLHSAQAQSNKDVQNCSDLFASYVDWAHNHPSGTLLFDITGNEYIPPFDSGRNLISHSIGTLSLDNGILTGKGKTHFTSQSGLDQPFNEGNTPGDQILFSIDPNKQSMWFTLLSWGDNVGYMYPVACISNVIYAYSDKSLSQSRNNNVAYTVVVNSFQ